MTDDKRRDDLAAAYLDGECTPDERAQVLTDADLLARVEQQRLVRAALAEPVPVDESRRELELGAALSVFDELYPARPSSVEPPAGAPPPPRPTVTRMADHRRRSTNGRRLLIGTGIAAAAIAAVGIAGNVDLDSGSDDDDTASVDFAEDESAGDAAASALAVEDATDGSATAETTAGDAGLEAADQAEPSSEPDAAAAEQTTSAAPADDDGAQGANTAGLPIEELGAFTDTVQLSTRLASILDERAATIAGSSTGTGDSTSLTGETFGDTGCAGEFPGATLIGEATVTSTPVLVVVTDADPELAYLLEPSTCAIVGRFDLPR